MLITKVHRFLVHYYFNWIHMKVVNYHSVILESEFVDDLINHIPAVGLLTFGTKKV